MDLTHSFGRPPGSMANIFFFVVFVTEGECDGVNGGNNGNVELVGIGLAR